MDASTQAKVQEVIKKIQEDPNLFEEFKKDPCKTVEKVAGINIPDFLEPQINKIAEEGIDKNADPMSIISKFLK